MTYNVLLGAMIITVLGSVASTTHLSSTNVIVKAILQRTQINATKQMLNLYPWIRNNWDLKEPELYLVEEITQLCSGNKVSIGGSPTQVVKGNKKNFNMLCNSRFLIGRIKFEVCAFRGVVLRLALMHLAYRRLRLQPKRAQIMRQVLQSFTIFMESVIFLTVQFTS